MFQFVFELKRNCKVSFFFLLFPFESLRRSNELSDYMSQNHFGWKLLFPDNEDEKKNYSIDNNVIACNRQKDSLEKEKKFPLTAVWAG